MAVAMGLPYLMLGLLGLGIIYGLAWAQARATIYTMTTARVVMRIGAALPVTFNLPFAQIGAAILDLRRDGTGTIALDTLGETRISVLVAWPHVRPGHWAKTQPALRSSPMPPASPGCWPKRPKPGCHEPQSSRTAPHGAASQRNRGR